MNSAETLVYVYQGRNLFLNFLSNILMKGNQISYFGLQVCSPFYDILWNKTCGVPRTNDYI